MALEEIRKSSTFKRSLELSLELQGNENNNSDQTKNEQQISDQPIQKMRRIDPSLFYREMPTSFDWVKKLSSLKKPISTKSNSNNNNDEEENKKDIEIFIQLKNAFEFVDK